MAGSTHTVTNQAPPLTGYDVFTSDRVLTEAVGRHLADRPREEALAELSGLGRGCGSFQTQEWGAQADAHPPVTPGSTVNVYATFEGAREGDPDQSKII
ncbi:hypothetical protein ACWDVV_34230, partial [Streptomyces tendae]